MKKQLSNILVAAVLLGGGSVAAPAAEMAWSELKPTVYGERTITADNTIVRLEAPYRAMDDRQVPITVQASLPGGAQVKAVTLIIDENPMPVSLSLKPDQKRSEVWLSANLRFNGPSPVRAVVEADDGRLFMSEAYVKTTGLGACASPPVTGMDDAIASLGRMQLSVINTPLNVSALAGRRQRVRLDISHPNLTGLQMDQITLRYILPRYVDKIEVVQGSQRVATMEAGISLSENPTISFDYIENGASHMSISARDTDDTLFTQMLPLRPGS